MKRSLLLAVVLAATATTPAFAQRMSDASFIAASRCIAYSDLPQLASDPMDVTALREAMSGGFRSQAVASQARDHANRVRARAASLAQSEGGIDELRERRDEACANFVERGLVQIGGSQAS